MTNLPVSRAPAHRILVLARIRWQIERLFKLWKSELLLDEWRTDNPTRILCEIYGKLIALVIQHWLFLMGDVHHLDRSLTLARIVIRHYSWLIVRSLFDTYALQACLISLKRALQNCRTHSSPKRLSTFKRLTA